MNVTDIGANVTDLREGDREEIAEQLGREPRGLVAIGARCACGRPAVTVTSPRLPDGSPFPTLFYLSLPYLVYQISRLEADGKMAEYNEALTSDPELAAAHAAAHESYVARRSLLGDVPEIAGVSAGGMPTRVKCLHALAGYSLAAGRGVCPIGDMALDAIGWDPDVCHCGDGGEGGTDDSGAGTDDSRKGLA
ncbi:MAG: DUF501 domain-containing protein [Ancrocorticia sp.]|uniref:DUF501 domain-containing protein n=1 Tax=Ancrocorticia sp. TaxID=2593684 RepID=UPI003F919793